MKRILLCLVCCLAVTLAENSREQVGQYINECKKELKIFDDTLSDPTKEACFVACMFKKRGDMKADGTLDIERITTYAPEDLRVQRRKDVLAKIEECEKLAKGDSCILAKCIFDDVSY